MKNHRTFHVGQNVYCLLSSHTKPNILIPTKGKIIDVKWDVINPFYKIRLLKLYDNMFFLKSNFLNMNFKNDFNKKPRKLPLKLDDINSAKQLDKYLMENDDPRCYVIVESIMCVKTKVQLGELFNKLIFFQISKNYKEIEMLSSRPFYNGIFSLDSYHEFFNRFKLSWHDKFKKSNIDIDKYLKSLR